MSDTPADAPPTLNYATPARRRLSWRWAVLIAGIVILAIVNVMPFANRLMPRVGGHSREPSRLLQCSSRLRMMGLAIRFYADENGDRLPPNLGDVLLTQPMSSDDFVCPSSSDTPAVAPTTQQAAALLLAPNGHHCSYVYVGDGLMAGNLLPHDVIAFEPPGHHGNLINVLFGDWRVERFDITPGTPAGAEFARLQAAVTAGTRPVRWGYLPPMSSPAPATVP